MNAAYYVGNRTIEVRETSSKPPKPDEVQINVAFSGICGTDLHIYTGSMDNRVTVPHVPGHECSGIVVEIGDNVTNFAIGDRVVVRPLDYCSVCEGCLNGLSHICYNMKFMGVDSSGCMQEYWNVPAHTVYKIPNISLEHAALIEPLTVACHDVSISQLQFGDDVLIIGGGPIGMLIAFVARESGAHVVVSEINEFRRNLLNELGFDVIDPNAEDLIDRVMSMTNGYGVDVVFEVSGSQAAVNAMTQVAKARGRIVQVAIISQPVLIAMQKVFQRELRLFGARVYEHKDYVKAIDLAASGKIPLDRLISRIEPLSKLGDILDMLTSGNQTDVMKVLIKCSDIS